MNRYRLASTSMANTTKPTRVATPKANTPAPVDNVEALGKAIGARYVLPGPVPHKLVLLGFAVCWHLRYVARD